MDWKNASYTHRVVTTAAIAYGSRLEQVLKKFENRIIDFRPPKEKELFVGFEGNEGICVSDWMHEISRFILSPPPAKVLARYEVTVYDRPPRKGEKFVSAGFFPDCYFAVRTGLSDEDYSKDRAITITPAQVK